MRGISLGIINVIWLFWWPLFLKLAQVSVKCIEQVSFIITGWKGGPVVCDGLDATSTFCVKGVTLDFLSIKCFAALTPKFKLALADLWASLTPDKAALCAVRRACTSLVSQGFWLTCVVIFLTVTSSTNLDMNPITNSAHSPRAMCWLTIAAFLKRFQSVHSFIDSFIQNWLGVLTLLPLAMSLPDSQMAWSKLGVVCMIELALSSREVKMRAQQSFTLHWLVQSSHK